MPKSKIKYILTWVALGVILVCGLGLLIFSWNRSLLPSVIPSQALQIPLMLLCWILISGAGIFLFMLAVKKAHRLWIDEEREQQAREENDRKLVRSKKDPSRFSKSLDIAATARKIVRRIPETVSLEEIGNELLSNLASEVEIMSGIFYLRKKDVFEISATYARPPQAEPFNFKEGEGLTGQVAKNQQLMVLTRLPEAYLEVFSGTGKSKPSYLAMVPLVHQNKTEALVECSGFRFDPHEIESMFRILARDLMEKISPNL